MTAILPHISLDVGKNPQHSIIWLHGLGADGQDFVPIVDELTLPVAVRYLFPHAPQRPVTINGGFVMRAWYDIASPAIDEQQDAEGISASQQAIERFIAQEIKRGIPAQNIYLAGFSQGGAIALHTALRQPTPLGGVLALSTYLPLADSITQQVQPTTIQTPIFMAHGKNDNVVLISLAKQSRDLLHHMGYRMEWHEYAMQHSVCEQELKDIRAWLQVQMTR